MGRAPGFSLALLGPALALLVSQGSLGLFWGSLKTLLVPLYESLGALLGLPGALLRLSSTMFELF